MARSSFARVAVAQRLGRLPDLPELNVAVFAFLVDFPWEILQAPFFEGMSTAPHWQATLSCTKAAFGDAGAMVIAYWIVAALNRSRGWILLPTLWGIGAFVIADVAINFTIERLATEKFGRWSYAESMPVMPFARIGLLPLLQWTLLTPLTAWFVRRQLSRPT
jgi:hypothetical protein